MRDRVITFVAGQAPTVASGSDPFTLFGVLNRMGQDRWELVAVTLPVPPQTERDGGAGSARKAPVFAWEYHLKRPLM